MKKKQSITLKEDKVLSKIDNIDINKEVLNILKNPIKFFEMYLKNIKNPLSKIFAYFSILVILNKIDADGKLCEKTVDYYIDKYSMEIWLEKLINLYTYRISLINYLLENHNNVLLDIYNEKIIDKETMEKGIKTFISAQRKLQQDVVDLNKYIEDLQKEKDSGNYKDGFTGFSGFGDED